MLKRNILILIILISFTYLAGNYPIYVHVAEDLPHGLLWGIVDARHVGAFWEVAQSYVDEGTYTFPDPPLWNWNGQTSQGVVDVWNFNHHYQDSDMVNTNP